MGGHALTTPTTIIFDLGVEQGIQQGEGRLAKLVSRLLTLNRMEDIRLAIKDKEVRHTFYKEFGM